jgi:hypothetical protein
MTLGLSQGLYLLAASTGTGKTAVAGQIALHVAEKHGPVIFVSMELTDVDLAVRLVSVITNIPREQLVTGKLTDHESQAVLAAVERLSKCRLHIVFGSGYTTSDVRAYALQGAGDRRGETVADRGRLRAVAHQSGSFPIAGNRCTELVPDPLFTIAHIRARPQGGIVGGP